MLQPDFAAGLSICQYGHYMRLVRPIKGSDAMHRSTTSPISCKSRVKNGGAMMASPENQNQGRCCGRRMDMKSLLALLVAIGMMGFVAPAFAKDDKPATAQKA